MALSDDERAELERRYRLYEWVLRMRDNLAAHGSPEEVERFEAMMVKHKDPNPERVVQAYGGGFRLHHHDPTWDGGIPRHSKASRDEHCASAALSVAPLLGTQCELAQLVSALEACIKARHACLWAAGQATEALETYELARAELEELYGAVVAERDAPPPESAPLLRQLVQLLKDEGIASIRAKRDRGHGGKLPAAAEVVRRFIGLHGPAASTIEHAARAVRKTRGDKCGP